jgi:hypothetical protein
MKKYIAAALAVIAALALMSTAYASDTATTDVIAVQLNKWEKMPINKTWHTVRTTEKEQ